MPFSLITTAAIIPDRLKVVQSEIKVDHVPFLLPKPRFEELNAVCCRAGVVEDPVDVGPPFEQATNALRVSNRNRITD